MDTRTIPPMKPVLVTDFSDSIHVLYKDDVTKQRTVLTARAIEDLFKCAPIIKTSESVELHPDNAYFDGTKVDLNRVVTAQSRYLSDNGYVNGPSVSGLKTKTDAPSGDAKWAVNHTPTNVDAPSGFLYVYSILEDDTLSWINYDGKIPIADKLGSGSEETTEDIQFRKAEERMPSSRIRQVFVPDWTEEYLPADGTKDPTTQAYARTHRPRYGTHMPKTRVGKYNDLLRIYQWEDWHDLKDVHNGPEYFTNITIDADIASVVNPLADAVYHVYSVVGTFELPNANLDAYKIGQKIIVEVHPPKTAGGTVPTCRVTYTDTLSRGEDAGVESMSVLVTPRPRINNKNVFGTVMDETLITSVAAFEIVETKDAAGHVYRTWELDSGAEETDFTGGLAQMLGEHTDTPVDDIVHAQDASRASQTSIDVLYPVVSSGYVKASFLMTQDLSSDSNWMATVKIIHPTSEAAFVAAGSTPESHLLYYVREADRWSLAENNGHPTTFDPSKKYYSLDYTAATASIVDVIPSISDPTILATDGVVHLVDLKVNKLRRFIAYATRGSLISVHIASNKAMSNYQGKVYPEIGFLPDPHSSYLLKAAINPSAFTNKQLQKLFLDGSVIGDIKLASCDELYEGILNSPCATRAVVEAYAYLAFKLQSKGLLFGNCLVSDATGAIMNTLVKPGHFYVKMPASSAAASDNFPPDFHVANNAGFNLIVLGNDHASAAMIHDEDELAVACDKVIQIGIVLNSGDPMSINSRLGTKSGSTWTWTPWKRVNDWSNIVNIPKYFRSRWDMFHSPNGMIDYIDHVKTHEGLSGEGLYRVIMRVPEGTVEGLLSAATVDTDNFSNEENINYEVPAIAVGVQQLSPGSLGASVPYQYYAEVIMPKAIETPGSATASIGGINARVSSKEQKHQRRRVRILLHSDPAKMTEDNVHANVDLWRRVTLHVCYCKTGKTLASTYNSATDQYEYDYVLNWGGAAKGYMEVEFEQIDVYDPTDGKYWRIWAPITVD